MFSKSESDSGPPKSSSLAVHVGKVDILVPLPKPKFGSNSLDTMIGSVAGNLITGETITFISVHVGGIAYETPPRAVKVKQQSVDFESDFVCPISDEWSTSDPSWVTSPMTSSSISITVRLNRKGLIDSEVIAVGKIRIPLLTSELENVPVALFPEEDDRAEIAICKLSINLTVLGSQLGMIDQMIKEMETLMNQFVANKQLGEDMPLPSDSLQQFLTSITPLRKIAVELHSLHTWDSTYAKSWLFLLGSMTMYPFGLIFALVMIVCMVLDISVPVLPYLSRVVVIELDRSRVPKRPVESNAKEIEKNFTFLTKVMDGMAAASAAIPMKVEAIVVGLLVVMFIPLNWLILAYMMWNTFFTQGIVVYIRKRRVRSGVKEVGEDEGQVTIHENQRWWLGKWSDKLIGNETYAWTNGDGAQCSKESIQSPPGTEWSSVWQARVAEFTDPDGWTYGQDFKSDALSFHSKRDLTDFVRTRKWSRKFRSKQLEDHKS